MPYPGNTTKAKFGLRVNRATATLPQTAQSAIFTVSGGRVVINALIGEVTTVIGATASNLSIVANPTVGADVNLTAVVAIANDAVGVIYSIDGTLATALAKGAAAVLSSRSLIVPVGTIDLLASGSTSGSVKWTVYYMPFDDNARIVAA